jgi:hypothetical protein
MTLRRRHLLVTATAALVAAGALAATAAGRPAAVNAWFELPGTFTVKVWQATSDNFYQAKGRLIYDGKPVVGARVRVDRFTIDAPTNTNGEFTYELDATLTGRHRVAVGDVDNATIGGKKLTQTQRDALVEGTTGSLYVAYGLTGLTAAKQSDGTILVTGRAGFADGKTPPPAVTIYTYRLTGTVTDSTGAPVVGAIVSTRTLDRQFWTISAATDLEGNYTSLFTASAEQPGNPVPFDIRIARGDDIFEFPAGEHVSFQRLQSARMDVQLPPTGFPIALPVAHSYAGAVYGGLVIGVATGPTVIDPVSARWVAKDGSFSLVLPASAAGKRIALWQRSARVFLTQQARPGAAIEKDVWPARVPVDAIPAVGSLTLPK